MLFECRSVLRAAQLVAGSERVKEEHINNPTQIIWYKYTKSGKAGLFMESSAAKMLEFSSAVARFSVGKENYALGYVSS